MPLEQDEPFHHENRGKRPHALLSHEDLGDRIEELEHRAKGRTSDALAEYIQEHYNRKEENKIEPGVPFAELREAIDNLQQKKPIPLVNELMYQPFDEDFQDLHRSDDIFEQAWGVVKFAAPANYLDEIQGRLGSNAPQPPAQDPGKQVCQGCNMAKMNIDPNTGMCSVCSARGPLNDNL
tara:strand:+ start:401 stop:940 length:540 start_codon:yes stop_codon:yes gene_type:complete